MSTERTGTKARGFASMSAERQREIARKGGRAAHQCGKAHEFTKDEARAAGRKGGEAVSANRTHMSEIGRLGGKRSAGRRASAAQSQTLSVNPGATDEKPNGARRPSSDSGHTDANQQTGPGHAESASHHAR